MHQEKGVRATGSRALPQEFSIVARARWTAALDGGTTCIIATYRSHINRRLAREARHAL
jgi:hypothetical protein